MKTIPYRLRIRGLHTSDGTISLKALLDISKILLECSERTLRLVVEGISTKRGKMPNWLQKSLDFKITGFSKGSTIIELEAPILSDTAAKQIEQQNVWDTTPDPNETALSLFAKGYADALTGKKESMRFDRGVLDSILDFNSIVESKGSKIEISSPKVKSERFIIAKKELGKIKKLESQIPPPQVTILSGLFNLIEKKGGKFELILDDGRKISGAIDPALVDSEKMREFWGRKATIKGTANFTATRKIQFFEAMLIKPFETQEGIFQSPQSYQTGFDFLKQFKKSNLEKSPLAEVWGKWPGDESAEELLALLKGTQ